MATKLTLPRYFSELRKLRPEISAVELTGIVIAIDDETETFDFRPEQTNRGGSDLVEIVGQPFAHDFDLVESNSGDDEIMEIGDRVSVRYEEVAR